MISGYMNREAGARSCLRYLKPFADAAGGVVLARHARALRAERFAFDGGDGATARRSGGIPTAIVCGSLDSLAPPRRAKRLAGSLAGATYHEIEGMGHFSPEEAPARLGDLLGGLLAG
jgi:pimeloyl-ACP methyl ester carboxylesterase